MTGASPRRQLVDQQQLRPAHQRAGDRQHLPLAAGEKTADARTQFGEAWKEMIGLLVQTPPLRRIGGARHRRSEVLRHRKIGEHLLAFGHQHDAAAGDLVRRAVFDPRACECNRSLGDAGVVDAEKSRNGAQCRGLAGAVGAEQSDDLPGCN